MKSLNKKQNTTSLKKQIMDLKGLGEWWRENNRKLGGNDRKLEANYRREKDNNKELKSDGKNLDGERRDKKNL